MIQLEETKRCNERLKELISQEIDERSLASILDERTETISKKRERYVEREVLSEVIVSGRGDMMLGFPVAFVKEVRKNYGVPLAHGNEIVVGLFQSRGRINALIDILPLVGQATAAQPALESAYIVHLSLKSQDIGVVVDELVGSRVLYKDEVASEHEEKGNGIVASISKDLVSVVDVKSLFSSPRIVLNQSGGNI